MWQYARNTHRPSLLSLSYPKRDCLLKWLIKVVLETQRQPLTPGHEEPMPQPKYCSCDNFRSGSATWLSARTIHLQTSCGFTVHFSSFGCLSLKHLTTRLTVAVVSRWEKPAGASGAVQCHQATHRHHTLLERGGFKLTAGLLWFISGKAVSDINYCWHCRAKFSSPGFIQKCRRLWRYNLICLSLRSTLSASVVCQM